MSQTIENTTSSQTEKVASKRSRLECRISSTIKQRAEQAATLLGQDLTTFTEAALNEKAQAVIEREERLVLSERDFKRFVAALESSQPPVEKLKAAAEKYKATSRQHPEANW
jgi:uncharacterized protein (DUF1778 family)